MAARQNEHASHHRGPLGGGSVTEPDAEQLLATLTALIRFLGRVYVEASGQCAQAHAVVGDLRRALAFLHSREEPGEARTPGAGAGSASSAYSASASASPATAAATHSPQASQPAAGQRGGGAWPSAAAGGPAHAAGPGTGTGQPAATMMATRRHRSAGPTTIATAAATPPTAAGSGRRTSSLAAGEFTPSGGDAASSSSRQRHSPRPAHSGTGPGGSGTLYADSPHAHHHNHHHSDAQSAAAPPLGPLHMPPVWLRAVRAYEDSMAAAAAVAGASGQHGPGSGGGGGGSDSAAPIGAHARLTASLCGAARAAGDGYQARLAALYDDPASSSSSSSGGGARRTGAHTPHSGGAHEPTQVHHQTPQAQHTHASMQAQLGAVVAAQAWVLAALRELPDPAAAAAAARKLGGAGSPSKAASAAAAAHARAVGSASGGGGGISADGLHTLLQELRIARLDLDDALFALRDSGGDSLGGLATPASPAATAAASPAGDGAAGVGEALAARGARWRNRFLRAAAAAAAARHRAASQHSSDPVARRLSPALPGSARARTGGRPPVRAAGGASSPLESPHYSGAAPHSAAGTPQPQQQQQRGGRGGGGAGGEGASAQLLLPRPVGVWLPDECWGLGLAAAAATAAAASSEQAGRAGSCASGAAATAGMPWLLALPPGLMSNWGGGPIRPGEGPPLQHAFQVSCPDVASSLAVVRAQQQLQLCLMQLHLEGSLAAGLLPSHPPPQQQQQQQGRHRHGGAGGGAGGQEGAWWDMERYLARCRLAHTFLVKGAWHRRACVAEVHLEGGA